MHSPLDGTAREAIGPVLGRLPSGLLILTVGDGRGAETGMLVSWVQQASFEPPMITVAVNRQRYVHDWIEESPRVALSLIGESQTSLLRHFGRGFSPDEPAFEGLQVARNGNGLPVLTEAPGWLEGSVVARTNAGDHVIWLVEITGGGASDSFGDQRPMVHIRKNGFSY